MALIPSITALASVGHMGPGGVGVGLVPLWDLFLFVGCSMSFIASSMPTSVPYTNCYGPDKVRLPLSFMIGVSNSLAWSSRLCAVDSGFGSEMFAATDIAVFFSPTKYQTYGAVIA